MIYLDVVTSLSDVRSGAWVRNRAVTCRCTLFDSVWSWQSWGRSSDEQYEKEKREMTYIFTVNSKYYYNIKRERKCLLLFIYSH